MNNLLFRIAIMVLIVLLIGVVGLTMYNNNTKKKAVEYAITAVEEAFHTGAKYSAGSSRIIVEKYIEDEESLYQLTKEALPKLSIIGDYDVVELLSVRAYYGETKNNPQFYDIKFRDINKLEWGEISNFDDFLFYLNTKSD